MFDQFLEKNLYIKDPGAFLVLILGTFVATFVLATPAILDLAHNLTAWRGDISRLILWVFITVILAITDFKVVTWTVWPKYLRPRFALWASLVMFLATLLAASLAVYFRIQLATPTSAPTASVITVSTPTTITISLPATIGLNNPGTFTVSGPSSVTVTSSNQITISEPSTINVTNPGSMTISTAVPTSTLTQLPNAMSPFDSMQAGALIVLGLFTVFVSIYKWATPLLVKLDYSDLHRALGLFVDRIQRDQLVVRAHTSDEAANYSSELSWIDALLEPLVEASAAAAKIRDTLNSQPYLDKLRDDLNSLSSFFEEARANGRGFLAVELIKRDNKAKRQVDQKIYDALKAVVEATKA